MADGVKYALGVDVGTTHTKVALVDVERARTLAVAAAPTPGPDRLEAVVADLVGQVLAAAPRAVPAAVGIASMAETGVPVGPDDEPRGDWQRWDGHRAGTQSDELARRLGRDALFAATGVRASAKVPLATWAWLRDEHGAASPLHDGGRWAGAADLLALALTGELVTDHTLAGRTMAYRLGAPGALPDAFDADLLAEVGLVARNVPRVLWPGETLALRPGPLTDAGLRVGTPVTVAGHDHPVGAFGAGVRAPGDVADSVGTAEVVATVLAEDPDPAPVAAAGMSLVRTVRSDLPALVAGSSSAGGAVAAWLAELEPTDAAARDRLLARSSDVDDDLLALLADPSGFVVLPYVHGRQTPRPDPAATLRAVGDVPADPVAALRGVLLGATLQARWMLDVQSALAGAAPRRVLALGGPMVASPAWAALKAWCTPVPLDVVTDEQAVAAGAALLAAERAGLVAPAPPLATHRPPAPPRPPRADTLTERLTTFTHPTP